MKFLHVMTAYTIKPQNIMSFIDKNFNKNEHTFLILADEKYVLKNNPQLFAFDNILFVPQIDKTKKSRFLRAKYLYKLFSKAENIVWHSFLGLKGIQLLYVTYIFRKKITWIEHCIDLYYWKWKPKGIKDKIAFYLSRKIREDCKNYGTTMWWDYYVIRRDFNKKEEKHVYFLPTPLNSNAVRFLQESFVRNENVENKYEFNILIGTDGLKNSNHYKIINNLIKYKKKHFSCFIPMNFALPYEYGLIHSRKYNTEVIEYGNRNLEHRVIQLDKGSVSLETYFKVLDAMDICIFDFNRPFYLDIIFYLLYLEKKVFLPSDSFIYKDLCRMGFKVFKVSDISENMSPKKYLEESLIKNKQIAEKMFEDNYCREYWDHYFCDVVKVGTNG